MAKITIHGFSPSTYTRTARMAAIEAGVSHELVPLAFGQPEHLALHPFGKIPVLTNGNDTVFESLAIVAYLDRNFGSGELLPAEESARILCTISAASDYAYRPVVHGEKDNEAQMSEAALVFDWLERLLEGNEYLSGGKFSAADLFVAPMLDYHLNEAGSDHIWRGRARLEQWFNTVSDRESFRATAAN